MSFAAYAAIDWSGAKGDRHPGIAIALIGADDHAPRLITPPSARHWSRRAVADWLTQQAAGEPTLFGFDFSFAPPFVTRGAYLPGDAAPESATAFWAYVERCCGDADLGAASFLEDTHRRHFYFGAADGRKADYMHWRQCELAHNAAGGQKASTVFDAIGAAQVAKASFSGMRLLHHVHRHVPVWPFDAHPDPADSLIVEIYTSIAARAAGLPKGRSKVRDKAALASALASLGSAMPDELPRADNHAADALMTAAWLRQAAKDAAHWSPAGLTADIARTEGWTFGICSPKGADGAPA